MTQIAVAIRIKPEDNLTLSKSISLDLSENVIDISVGGVQYEFPCDKIFNSASSQEDIFTSCGLKVINGVLDGFNATVLTYGQTGAFARQYDKYNILL